MNETEYVVVSDFDGTITLQDSNGLIVEILGNEENAKIEEAFIIGLAGNRETLEKHFQTMLISLQEYKDFLDEHIRMDPDFDSFLGKIRVEKIPFFIVSAGFKQGIRHILGHDRVAETEIYANDLVGEERLITKFAMNNLPCTNEVGTCGNCKRMSIEEIRRKTDKKIIYIGDGMTDVCVVDGVDLLFAKDYLADYCESNQIPYIPFKQFRDVEAYLTDKQFFRKRRAS